MFSGDDPLMRGPVQHRHKNPGTGDVVERMGHKNPGTGEVVERMGHKRGQGAGTIQ